MTSNDPITAIVDQLTAVPPMQRSACGIASIENAA